MYRIQHSNHCSGLSMKNSSAVLIIPSAAKAPRNFFFEALKSAMAPRMGEIKAASRLPIATVYPHRVTLFPLAMYAPK